MAAALGLAVAAALIWKHSQSPQPSPSPVHPEKHGLARRLPPLSPLQAPGNADKLAAQFSALLTRAGGDEAWVKRPSQQACDPRDPSRPGEVLALPAATDAIVARFHQQAARDGLQFEVRPAAAREDGTDSLRALSLRLSEGSTTVCALRLREVPRLYRAAIVIDDLGEELQPVRELLQMPYRLTLSVLPHLPDSRETATAANRAGREVMLHLPMEPLAPMNPGPGAIRVGMSPSEVDTLVEDDLASVPYVAGVNNHMGSRATSDPGLMSDVMKDLASHHLYFIDSRTAGSSVALEAARRAGIPAFYRSVFLDDTETVAYTLGQLEHLRALVLKQGVALAIGHPHPTTIAALEKFLPQLERDDIEVVPASELVRLPEVARLTPPHSTVINNSY